MLEMTGKNKGILWTALSMAMILGLIIVMPTRVGATPLGPFQFDVFGNGLVMMNVSITEVGTAGDYDYRYDYFVDVTSPANLYQLSIGLVDVDTLGVYAVKDAEFAVPPATSSLSRLTSNSLLVYFTPNGLGPGIDYGTEEWPLSITYDCFIEDQYISVRTIGTEGSLKTITARYAQQVTGSSVPEPMTLLLLGCGLVSLGLLSHRKR